MLAEAVHKPAYNTHMHMPCHILQPTVKHGAHQTQKQFSKAMPLRSKRSVGRALLLGDAYDARAYAWVCGHHRSTHPYVDPSEASETHAYLHAAADSERTEGRQRSGVAGGRRGLAELTRFCV